MNDYVGLRTEDKKTDKNSSVLRFYYHSKDAAAFLQDRRNLPSN